MMNNDLQKEDILIKKTIENVFDILRKNGFEIKEKKSTFQRTEQLLYLVPQLKEAVKHNKQKIKDLENFGIDKKSNAVHVVPTVAPLKQDETEMIDKEVLKLNQRNHIINTQIKWVNSVIHTISNDKYYDLIKLKYYDNKTREEIAEYFECDVKTISRNRNRIINHIKGMLFPNDSVDELGY